MKPQVLAMTFAVLISITLLIMMLALTDSVNANHIASLTDVPTVAQVDPPSAPNDLDTPIIITGASFTAGMTVTLGGTPVIDTGWVSSTTLTTTVPWGMNAGVYTLTVGNSDGQSGSLPNAFTVTQGIGVWTTGGPYGGRVSSIVINPITPTTLYATAMEVGLFRSRDAGQNWEQIFYSNGSEDIIALDALNPNRLYTGRSGQGLFRSDDGGDTWVAIPFPVQGAYVNRAFTHPTISGRVYAGLSEGGFFESDDYGLTWITKTNGLTDTQVMAMAFHPADALTFYVGTRNGNVFRSVNAGAVWEFIGQLDTFVNQLAVNPFGANELWAASNFWGRPGHLWKYAAGAWFQVSPGVDAQNSVNIIVFNPHISGTLWIGSDAGGFRSTDGGSSWAPFTAWSERYLMALAADPTDLQVIYHGYAGPGIYKTTDNGASWQGINQGLSAVLPRGLALVPGDLQTVYAGAEFAGAFKTSNGGQSWLQLPLWHDPGLPIVEPMTSTRIYMSMQGDVKISDNGGLDWHTASLSSPPQYTACCHRSLRAMIATTRPGHMVLGVGFTPKVGAYNEFAGAIYTSTDFGETWSYADFSQTISPVITLAADPFSPAVIYAGTGDPERTGTGLWKSMDGGSTWTPSGFSGLAVSGIAVDHRGSQTVYAVVNGAFCASHDAGQTWDDVSAHDEWIGQNLLYVPTIPPLFYVYDWRGMARSTDGGYHWQRPAGPLAYSNIGSMAVATTTQRVIIYIGTSGGMVNGSARQAQGQTAETLVNAGVYRQTTRLLNQLVYLPLIFKQR